MPLQASHFISSSAKASSLSSVVVGPPAVRKMPVARADQLQFDRVPRRASLFGLPCSSDEAGVMLVERRGQVSRRWERANWQQEELQFSTEGGSLRAVARAG